MTTNLHYEEQLRRESCEEQDTMDKPALMEHSTSLPLGTKGNE